MTAVIPYALLDNIESLKYRGGVKRIGYIKSLVIIAMFLYLRIPAPAADTNSVDQQWQHIAERMRVEVGITNFLAMTNMPLMRALIVDPSFGIRWDEVPPPTMTNSTAMIWVNAFVATNGWNMQTDTWFWGELSHPDRSKPIWGLPWTVIHYREFPAVTHEGVLYVFFEGWNYNYSGVAFNPRTNPFAPVFHGFKPIGQHWYVWFTTDDGRMGPQIYEGRTNEWDKTAAR
jgi:hypothetical protein